MEQMSLFSPMRPAFKAPRLLLTAATFSIVLGVYRAEAEISVAGPAPFP